MAKKIGLFYGTQTGNTQSAAEMIQATLGKDNVDLIDISGAGADDLKPINI
jgi:Flavodoxins